MSILVNIPEKYITLHYVTEFSIEPIINNDILDWITEHAAELIFDYDQILNQPMAMLHKFVFVGVVDDATAIQFKLTFGV
jgi:hypothetical protein